VYRAVLDPGVLIAALLSRTGAPAQLLMRWIRGEFELIVSPRLLNELRTALQRPKFRRYVTADEVEAYWSLLEQRATVVVDPEPHSRLTPDPGDDYLVSLARVAAAHYLVSGDTHLTGLRRSQPPILTPRAFLSALEKSEGPGASKS
jgi:putative PIN family toxin of toxin-antitoxin system